MAEGAWPALSPGGAVEGAGPRGSPLVFLSPKPWGSWQTACPRLGQRWQSAQHEASHQPLRVLPRTSLGCWPSPPPCLEGTAPPGRLRAAPVTVKLEGQHPVGPNSRTELSCVRMAKGCTGPSPLPSELRIPRWRPQSSKLSMSPAKQPAPHERRRSQPRAQPGPLRPPPPRAVVAGLGEPGRRL